jgi:hypothetical protein
MMDNDDYPSDDGGYPTVASTEPVFNHRAIFDDRSPEQMLAIHLAYEASIVAHETGSRLEQHLRESPLEIWKRLSSEKEEKEVKAAKATAKKSVKKGKTHKITSHFKRKVI